MFQNALAYVDKYSCANSSNGPPNSCTCTAGVCFITDAIFYDAIANCLAESPEYGLCDTWGTQLTNYGTMPEWDTSRVTNMAGWNTNYVGFGGKSTFNGNISNWKTSRVTNMYRMFAGATVFNQDISNWDTSQTTTMSRMFEGASAFDIDITSWNCLLYTSDAADE